MNHLESEQAAARPWLAQYPPGVPAEIDLNIYPSVASLLETAAATYPEAVAYHQFGVDVTFRNVNEASLRLAAFFQLDLQLRPGDRIALMLPNVIQYPIAMFAALRAGLVVVNVNPLCAPAELVQLFSDSEPRAIIVLETFAATLQQVLKIVTVGHVVVARIADMQPFPKSLSADFAMRQKKKLVPDWFIPTAIKFKHALRRHSAAAFQPPALHHENVAFLQYTSGATGAPKGAVLTHGNILANVLMCGAWLTPVLRGGRETAIIALPLHHVTALVCQCLVSVHFGTRAILVINPRDIPSLTKDFATHHPTVFGGLNTLFAALLDHEDFRKLDFSELRFVGAGGAPTRPSIAERWQALTGQPIVEVYGSSEVSGAATAVPVNPPRFDGTIGLPLPSVQVEIRDDGRRSLPFGEVGEICIKGPLVMRGYYNRPEETAKVLGPDGFFATGDIGLMTEEGSIKIVDSKKDTILVSGFTVCPTEVEDVLTRMQGVLEAMVVGVPDPHAGEIPVAYIVKNDPALAATDVIAFARQNLAAYKVPQRAIFIGALPKTPVGKVLRCEWRALAGAQES